ncbi:hypothetical protein MtrunA17_Chr4g0068961 [Medicago truncatula]|uniref:Uncharacterized protein n=1 Tax=Medicago truncatula TaxID=3880 RepID=A0A396IIB8_MEDTR|nr:hypothetical protein MtrunA17_Chr4g0068961 [Medicago truncatula]
MASSTQYAQQRSLHCMIGFSAPAACRSKMQHRCEQYSKIKTVRVLVFT